MTAKRYLLRLYKYGSLHRETETNLDPKDNGRLRELLEQEVKADRGTLDLDLSAGWKLVVHSLGGGRIHARARVDGSGRTVVKR